MKNKKIIIIAGPTAVGKTALSVSLAKRINGEIISADSMQIYKQMDIGTAKVTASESSGITHHMIDIVSPQDDFTVADYANLAREKIEDILSKGKVPIIVGGTGLYINSIVFEMDFNNSAPDTGIRNQYNTILLEQGSEYLYSILAKKNPEAANSIHPNNTKRVIRALEILDSKDDFSNFENAQSKYSKYDSKIYILSLERSILYNRINSRVDTMINNGLVDEVKDLLSKGLNNQHQSMKAIGYRQIISYLTNDLSLDDAVDLIKRDSRRYAKRQFTWFKKYKDAKWLDVGSQDIEKLTELILNDYNKS